MNRVESTEIENTSFLENEVSIPGCVSANEYIEGITGTLFNSQCVTKHFETPSRHCRFTVHALAKHNLLLLQINKITIYHLNKMRHLQISSYK